jgi:hypothetical protein
MSSQGPKLVLELCLWDDLKQCRPLGRRGSKEWTFLPNLHITTDGLKHKKIRRKKRKRHNERRVKKRKGKGKEEKDIYRSNT